MSEALGGVETGGTFTVCVLGTAPDDIRNYAELHTTTPAETLAQVARFFADGPEPPVAVGVGAFGPLDLDPASPNYGSVTTTPKPGWQGTQLLRELESRLGVPVTVDTDTAAAGLAEHLWGAGRGAPSIAYLTVGTGIGGAILDGTRVWHGLIHSEVGHLRIPHDRVRDPFEGVCPMHGDCWEGLASGPAITARWGTEAGDLPDGHPAWELEAEYLALGIFAIVAIASPHLVIVGGGVPARAGLLARVARRVVELNAGYLDSPLLGAEINRYVVAPALGDRAGALGAIALAQLARMAA